MSIITAEELGADYEDVPAPEGEYSVRIQKAEVTDTKDGLRQRLKFGAIIEGGDYAYLSDGLNFPLKEGGDDNYRRICRDFSRFFALFGVSNEIQIDKDDEAKTLSIVNEAEIPQILAGKSANVWLEQKAGMSANETVNRMRLPKR
jgi:hypothetical protein